jgi:hypothetical protein
MGINKIKLKQIDADFSGLVGQYGSGYFSTTGQLISLSGSAFKYSDIATTQFVYQTGNQNISGSKTFFSRPIISGAGIAYSASGVARLGEVVTLANNETINGTKTFNAPVNLYSDVNFQANDVDFQGVTFVFDTTSSQSLAQALASSTVSATANQSIGGIKNFTGVLNVKGTGVLVSGQVNPCYISGAASTSTVRYPTFIEGNFNSSKILQAHTGLVYNPLNSALSGNYAGLFYNSPETTNTSRNIIFTSNNNAGYKDLRTNGNIFVNPSAGSVHALSFEAGSFSGNLLGATSNSNLRIGTFTSLNNISFEFPAGTAVYNMSSSNLSPVATAVKDLGTSAVRWKDLYISAATVNTSDFNLKTEISEIPDSWLDAWQEVDYARYKFKDAAAQKGISGARWHVGLIAQDIHEKFQNHGLNAFEIGMLCYDKWDSYIDPNGKTIPSGEIWSIRPDECQFMEMALMRRSINRLKSGILI